MGVDLSQTVVSRKNAQAEEEKGKRPGMEEWSRGGDSEGRGGRNGQRPKAAIAPTEKGLQVPGWIRGSRGQGSSYVEEKPASFTDLVDSCHCPGTWALFCPLYSQGHRGMVKVGMVLLQFQGDLPYTRIPTRFSAPLRNSVGCIWPLDAIFKSEVNVSRH